MDNFRAEFYWSDFERKEKQAWLLCVDSQRDFVYWA